MADSILDDIYAEPTAEQLYHIWVQRGEGMQLVAEDAARLFVMYRRPAVDANQWSLAAVKDVTPQELMHLAMAIYDICVSKGSLPTRTWGPDKKGVKTAPQKVSIPLGTPETASQLAEALGKKGIPYVSDGSTPMQGPPELTDLLQVPE